MEENSKQPRIHKLPIPLKDSSEATFFLVVGPGLEEQARVEAVKYLGAERIETVTGGVQFDSTWGRVRVGQPRLRVATRVLVRVDQFGVRDFQKLFRKVSNIPWEEWLKPKVGISVRAASTGSRLRIKSGIEESVSEAFRKSFKMPPPRPVHEVMCLVRVDDDICTISLDLSGDLLHKRGTHTDVGQAPLRETFAASVVEKIFETARENEDVAKLFSASWDWVEPMAGTAVFLREAFSDPAAKDLAAKDSAKEASREFAIDQHFKFERDETLTSDDLSESSRTSSQFQDADEFKAAAFRNLSKAVLVDRDGPQLVRAEKALLAALKNARGPLASKDLVFRVDENASLERVKELKSEDRRLVILNPPWGQRLKGPDATDSVSGQAKLLASIEAKWKPAFVAVVMPRLAGGAAKLPGGWREFQPLEFRVGGIPVQARFFAVSDRL